MRLIFWILGMVSLLHDLLKTFAIKTQLHLDQDSVNLLKELGDFDITTPCRVNIFGEPFPKNQHFRRKKRSLTPTTEQWNTSQTHYKLNAFGKDFHFSLTATSGFIAPLYTVTFLGAPEGNQTDVFTEDDEDIRHCFYHGMVNGHPEHIAVLSLCSGMHGTFRSHDGDYFVEPLSNLHRGDFEEGNNQHIVYRPHTSKKLTRDIHSCATSEKNHHRRSRNRRMKQTSDTWTLYETINRTLSAMQFSITGNKSINMNATGIHKRTKRFLSYPRYVEVMVVADNKMVAYHGANLQHYILTLMSIVASIYKDPSIGNLINIVIVKLTVITNEQNGPSISFSAHSTLKHFCVWQKSHNHPDDQHHSHHDTAILITRQDICRAANKCDTLGLAELGTMCDPYRSCSIIEDNGLSTAFTIAHELGHVFNMPHDDSNKCNENGMKTQSHVMAPILTHNTKPWLWSKCSRKYITEFLDTGYGECLLDEPVVRTYTLPQQLPGQVYNISKQCEIIFGPGSQVCPYMMQCRRLWCTSSEGAQRGCRTQHTPWADGTECEPGKHCKHGHCVAKESSSPPTDGSWGAWSPFGACSRSCGGGIKTSLRECNRPEPRNGGRYCVGRRMKFKSCNTNPCPMQKDFRDDQCAQFNGRHLNMNGISANVTWVPKYSGILLKDRCKLFCRVAGSSSYFQLRDRVIDGTPCGPNTNDICVQGLCRQAGCDHVLNSKARRDKCGVCGGDNTSCKPVAGTFNTAIYGYNRIVRIPSGATNIDVQQHSYSGRPEDDNYLALANHHGEFLINGHFVVSMFKRDIKVGNAVIEYSGSGHAIERINCTDRIEEELEVQVLSVGRLNNPDVRYTFNIPIEDKAQHYFWNPNGSWQDCSALCQGERRRKLVCIREEDLLVVSDQRCDRISQPSPIVERCNMDCEVRWHIARKSECTAQCGHGYRSLDIYCTKYIKTSGKTEKIDERFCVGIHKPNDKEGCVGDCTIGGWQYSSWSECSKSCGGGLRRRLATCINSLGAHLDDNKCSMQEKVIIERCNEYICPQWSPSEWSECLVTCGKGHRHRHILCHFGEQQVDDRFCSPETKQESLQTCQQPECSAWQVGPWGQCTVSCGQGYQIRAVKCVAGAYGNVVDDNECNAGRRPTDSQDCEMAPCPALYPSVPEIKTTSNVLHEAEWRFGSWTPCSATCGKGSRIRYVSCRDFSGVVANEAACSHLPKPPVTEECVAIPCGQWKALDWSLCSVSCGQGKAKRQITCVDFGYQIVDGNECDSEDMPATEQECNMPPCDEYVNNNENPIHSIHHVNYHPRWHSRNGAITPGKDGIQVSDDSQWRIGPWGACSSTCAGGFQRRAVVCQDLNGYRANSCNEQTKPTEQRSCEAGPCPQWAYGSWGKCTKSCGGGIRTRHVICHHPSGERLNDQNCEILEKPPDREQCNTQGCPPNAVWKSGPWSSCSVSCGKGIRMRFVSCVTKEGKQIEDLYCSHLTKPDVQRKCRGGRCPKWNTEDWGQCSVSCGQGTQKRDVNCLSAAQKNVQDSECILAVKPTTVQLCHLANCPDYHWKSEDWQECSKTCGSGIKIRKVVCVNDNNEEASSMLCQGNRPPDTDNCSVTPCEYVWITGEWSECSVTCDYGYQRRLVTCSEIYNNKDHYEYGFEATVQCPGTQPPTMRSCYSGECQPSTTWSVGNWGSCSVSCGEGVMHRSVRCLTSDGQTSNRCPLAMKPEESVACQNPDCDLPTSCQDLQQFEGLTEDNEYLINIQGKIVKIYCASMQSDSPREYISLLSGDAENFSEVFGLRLLNPTECPHNGNRREDCHCKRDYTAAGFTTFSKVRIDLSTMQIITTDLHFAHTREGWSVPFATAGDCYSAARCPQGQFSINLHGTGFSIHEDTQWATQGNYAVMNLQRAPDGGKVKGKCGGYCGKCTPSSTTGLLVKVL
ncbi:A disintegrin and metalloproteinase with thrombospondin motifs 9 [Protopterus annectens]|uniref:A disintegrin and metalloproteinase with thrombospondin motifs 9 n=1 Tax=Protopterus annectens TaxID=7888 RepID=UPI001CF960F6|nr:A disintegrin and metalloproteinase with thrombospondin motifs 9 [Protopterus annectens]